MAENKKQENTAKENVEKTPKAEKVTKDATPSRWATVKEKCAHMHGAHLAVIGGLVGLIIGVLLGYCVGTTHGDGRDYGRGDRDRMHDDGRQTQMMDRDTQKGDRAGQRANAQTDVRTDGMMIQLRDGSGAGMQYNR